MPPIQGFGIGENRWDPRIAITVDYFGCVCRIMQSCSQSFSTSIHVSELYWKQWHFLI